MEIVWENRRSSSNGFHQDNHNSSISNGLHQNISSSNGFSVPNECRRRSGPRGALIVLEGLDRSGKTTQAKLLLDHLLRESECGARIQRFPDRQEPTTGPIIDAFLRNAQSVKESREAIHLIFAANRWKASAEMRRELDRGQHLIVDRYSHSGIAYSMAKGIDRHWACQPEVGLPRPDLVLFFDIDSQAVSRRNGFGQEAFECGDFQQLVYEKMKGFFDDSYWRRIDAARPVEEVHQAVVKEVGSLLERMQQQQIADPEPVAEFSADDFAI